METLETNIIDAKAEVKDADENTPSINETEEQKKYDRQIRLWGVDAQRKMHNAKILMLGFNGIASETAKILSLAGVTNITIIDDRDKVESDIRCNLFCGRLDSIKFESRCQEIETRLGYLNPRGRFKCLNESICSKDGNYFKNFDLVCMSELLPIDEVSRVNEECRKHGVLFYVQIEFGLFGFFFNDLGPSYVFSHEEVKSSGNSGDIKCLEADMLDNDSGSDTYRTPEKVTKKRKLDTSTGDDRPESNGGKHLEQVEKVVTTKTIKCATFGQVMNNLSSSNLNKTSSPTMILSLSMFKFFDLYKHTPRRDEEDMNRFDQIVMDTLKECHIEEEQFKKRIDPEWRNSIHENSSALASIVGGLSGQDILRAVSRKSIPIHNTFAFDGLNLSGTVERIGPIEQDQNNKPIVHDCLTISDDDDDDVEYDEDDDAK